jgi:hypothetical protein
MPPQQQHSMFGRHRDVLLYIPNLIGEHQPAEAAQHLH